jgi:hypothetical protein
LREHIRPTSDDGSPAIIGFPLDPQLCVTILSDVVPFDGAHSKEWLNYMQVKNSAYRDK